VAGAETYLCAKFHLDPFNRDFREELSVHENLVMKVMQNDG